MLCVVNIQDTVCVTACKDVLPPPLKIEKKINVLELHLAGRDVLVTLPTGHGSEREQILFCLTSWQNLAS